MIPLLHLRSAGTFRQPNDLCKDRRGTKEMRLTDLGQLFSLGAWHTRGPAGAWSGPAVVYFVREEQAWHVFLRMATVFVGSMLYYIAESAAGNLHASVIVSVDG